MTKKGVIMENVKIIAILDLISKDRINGIKSDTDILNNFIKYIVSLLKLDGIEYKQKTIEDHIKGIIGAHDYNRMSLTNLTYELKRNGFNVTSQYVRSICDDIGVTVKKGGRNRLYVYRDNT